MELQINGSASSSQRVNRDAEHFKVFIIFKHIEWQKHSANSKVVTF